MALERLVNKPHWSRQTPYDTKLTVAGPTDLADMTGAVLMTDGTWSVDRTAKRRTSW